MKNFINNIITFSLRNKFFILFMTLLVVIFGVYCFEKTPVDAFPDITNTNVTIITQWPGRSAEEVEKFVTIPIELAMNPVQKKTIVRSTTLFGLSVVNVLFDDHVDDSSARRRVARSAAGDRTYGRDLQIYAAEQQALGKRTEDTAGLGA